MTIRKAEIKDISDIIRLLKQVNLIHHEGRPDIFKIGTKYTPRQLAEIIGDSSSPVLVAEDNGQIMGYAFCVFQTHTNDNILTDIKTLYIDDLCVDEQFRGKHIGKELCNAVLVLAKENSCYNITLNAWSLNPAAIKFYEKCGMQPLKVCMEKIVD